MIDRCVRLYAKENVVPGSVGCIQVVGIVRRYERDSRAAGKPDHRLVYEGLLGERVVHDLQIEIALAHDVLVKDRPLLRPLLVSFEYQRRDFSGKAGRGGDQPP